MARFDKYHPVAGGFRAALAANYTGAATPLGVGLDTNGRVVAGAGTTGVLGVICQPRDKSAGDVIDIMTAGEIVELAGGDAGSRYYAHATTGVISTTLSIYPVGFTVEATRLVVRSQIDTIV